jgi:hypothetical protein
VRPSCCRGAQGLSLLQNLLAVVLCPVDGHSGGRPLVVARNAIEIFYRLLLVRILRGHCALNKLAISILDLLKDAVDLVGCRLYLSILSLHMPQSLL